MNCKVYAKAIENELNTSGRYYAFIKHATNTVVFATASDIEFCMNYHTWYDARLQVFCIKRNSVGYSSAERHFKTYEGIKNFIFNSKEIYDM